MNEHSRDDPFAHIQPVDPEEFEFAVRKGTEAGRYRAPMRGPGTRRVKIVDDEEDSRPPDLPPFRTVRLLAV